MFRYCDQRHEQYLGYVTGFFDGEGNVIARIQKPKVGSNKLSPTLHLGLQFSQAHELAIQVLQSRVHEITKNRILGNGYMGTITRQGKEKRELATKDMYTLTYTGTAAYELSKVMLSLCIVKADTLQWLINVWENRKQPNSHLLNYEYLEHAIRTRPNQREERK